MDDDWDLHAVVRGCAAAASSSSAVAAATTTITTSTSDPFPSFSSTPFNEDQNPLQFAGVIDDRNENPFKSLQEIYRELCVDLPPPSATTSAASTIPTPAGQVFQPHQEIVQIQLPRIQTNMQNQESIQFMSPRLGSSNDFPAINPLPIRPRRRKNQQMKMVRQMTQEELSADSWAWRKYGQKPIKGSPYPRNYYRCSTSKGCAARKQVERSPNDQGVFVVSYTGEHTHPRPAHRSSLAGSTRSKFSSSPSAGTAAGAAAKSNNNKNNAHLLQKGSTFSPTTPLVEGEAGAQNDDAEMVEEENGGAGDDDEENMITITSDLMNDDEDMFKGFQDSD